MHQQHYQILASPLTKQGQVFLKAHTNSTEHCTQASCTDVFLKKKLPDCEGKG